MCGIAGYLDLPGTEAFGRAVLAAMVRSIAHRGPDGNGIRQLGRCGLGHVRLSIIDLATGEQPMADETGQVWLSFNGEIFNYVELREELIAKGYRFRTTSDTEVIIHLYREMGPACVTRMNGDFAFALWDVAEQRLMLSRDRMGVRPLYYVRRGDTLGFASEVKALLEIPGVEAELDPIALDQIFTTWSPLPPRTVFKNILEVPPGHTLLATPGRVSVKPYWALSFPRAHEVPPDGHEKDHAPHLRELLRDATMIRMRADVPVGAYLSGGLDSSIVTAMATSLGHHDLRSFSVTFENAEYDESAFQQIMAEALGTRHFARRISARDISASLPAVVAHTEKPMLRTAPAPLFLLAEAVRQDGIKVVLTGEGADEVFGGYDIFKEAKLRRFVSRQPTSRWRPSLLTRLYPYLPRMQGQSPAFLNAFFGGARDDSTDPLFSHLPRYRTTSRAKAFFSAAMKADIGRYDALAELRESLPRDFVQWHPLSQAQYLETAHLLPGYILSSQGDRMAMAHGVEGRFPFLDHRVVEFAAKLPPGLKLRGLREKHLLREATKDLLPAEIADRPKQPYRAPEAGVFFGADATPAMRALFDEANLSASGVFEPDAVSRLVKKAEKSNSLGFAESAALVGIATTQLLQRRFTGLPEAAHEIETPRRAASM